ncbi:unnamed protein product [Rotaria sp. Silwood1]|nr:unnamed protein product [Rotaria sp. Silwood1]CAF0865151.1 unnamed protein product [Rotaria sp. Silwood1]CAF3384082.1 unnamed protein product [Rotaria sp. Silwood1]CAF4580656.1 unnamed protein product [Rotaria sp. Silwood1]CAF4610772.1 unnamed protein product [Rotaria sp. Silwood1]
MFFLFILIVSPLLSYSSLSDEWHSKSQCTQKEFANHMDISCNSNEFILIGWSHYGTKKPLGIHSLIKSEQQRCEPSESDCIMDYTHKIAELCNGVSKCEVILTQQFIHKCSDEATYLFISYQCINNSTIVDVCSKQSIISSNGLNLISPLFPNEYPNNINCTCRIEPVELNKQSLSINIDVESLSFNLQDNDYLSSSKSLSLSGTIPFGASLFNEKNSLHLTFTTDETLSQSGFWIRLHGYHQCNNDEYTLGSKCIKIFQQKQTWNNAQEKCLSIGSHLIHLNDIVQEKKLTYFLLTNYEQQQQQQQTSFWISDQQENYNIHSWWPWRLSLNEGKCVLRTQDGWIKRPCDELQAFICERDINRQSIPLTVRCGNAQAPLSSTIIITTPSSSSSPPQPTTTIITSTRRPTVSFIQPPIVHEEIPSSIYKPHDFLSSINTQQVEPIIETKTNSIDPNILASILGGVALAIFSVNIIVCYICKRRTQKPSKCKTPIESQSSFTHEELQRSLMQHLYHEQTNTISSTSTSSSKHSQSKSNDTSTTTAANVNLLQLCSPPHPSNSSQSYITRSNAPATALCFRNPHAAVHNSGDPIDYHFYETIPSENTNYNVCTAHSAFKPVLQSNSHTIRPFLPRTNIFYHPPGLTKQSFDTTSSSTTTTSAVLMPVCCHHHHHLSQCSTGTLRQHISPRIIPPPPPPITADEQTYMGSESIV